MKKSPKKFIDVDRVPKDLVQNATELLSLPEKTVEKLAKKPSKPYTDGYDYYTLFLNAREERLYQNRTENDRLMFALRCLVPMDPRSAEQILKSTVPPGNIIHAIERLTKASRISKQTAKRSMFQFLLSCSKQVAIRYGDNTTIVDITEAARGDGAISDKVANVAKASFYMLVDPSTVDQMIEKDGVAADDFDRMFHLATSRKLLANGNHARMRRWKPIFYDEIQSIFVFYFPEGSKVPSYPFYRKPAQFLAASMATAGYNEKEVAMAIDKLWQMRKGMGFMDAITLRYLSSGRYQKSVSNLSTLLKDSWRR